MRKRDLIIVFGALTLAAAVAVGIFRGLSLQTGSWGLSFRQEGQRPVGSASAENLQTYNAAYIGAPEEKVIYLTFDAGYENGCTAKILDTLKAHKVPAAFFLVGITSRKTRT